MRLSILKGGKRYFIKYLPLLYDMSLEILTYQINNYI